MSTTVLPANTSSSVGDPTQLAREWLDDFVEIVRQRDTNRLPEPFVDHGSWRDLLALTWQLRSAIGLDRIGGLLAEHVVRAPAQYELRTDPPVELVDLGEGARWIQAFFTFDVDGDAAHGMVRLAPDPDDADRWRAWTVVTDLLELRRNGHVTEWSDISREEFTRPVPGYRNWRDRRTASRNLDGLEPTVLVVGAGQCGLHIAARLQHLGVDNVIIEREARLGTSWRNRHYNLRTHTPSFADSFPYLLFPPNWPISAEKDKLADWCEFYASAMDLDVHTGTELRAASYSADAGRWTVELARESGETVTMRPRHLVIATGLLSLPKKPKLPGAEKFKGSVLHSSEYRGAEGLHDKRVVVVGTGASGHDIAQDLYEQGVRDVTLVQRSATYVMSFEHGIPAAYAASYGGCDLEISDLMFKSFPLPVLVQLNNAAAPGIAAKDRELLDGLKRAGFQLLEDTGMLELAYTPSVSGYYINQGCSDLIVDGSIALKSGEVSGLDEGSVLFSDGSSLPADVLVLCTGYENMRESVRALLGSEVADHLPEVWVIDHDRGGEHAGLWVESGYPHLWLQAGALQHSRVYSKHLALKIAALEGGLVEAARVETARVEDGGS